jgi:uncharacterized protein YigE (DUF2233 family)
MRESITLFKRTACLTFLSLLTAALLMSACQPERMTDSLTRASTPVTLLPTANPSITLQATRPPSTATRTKVPSPTSTATLTPTPISWKSITRGVEQAYLAVPTPGTSALSYIYTLRIDPAAVDFKVHYDRAEPHMIEEWQSITEAPIIFNGGFFGGNNDPVGRIVIDGQVLGTPLDYGDDSAGVPGLFAVADGKATLYTLGRASYNPRGLRFDQAVESYPMLLLPGGQPTFQKETGYKARRTVIAIDEQGQVVVMLIDIPMFSLFELSNWLADSGLALDSALNLDGGRSSALAVNLPGETKVIASFVSLPIMIGVYPK